MSGSSPSLALVALTVGPGERETALPEWLAIRDQAWAKYPDELRNESNFMPGAMVLDKFYDQLDLIADDLLPIAFQGRVRGTYALGSEASRTGSAGLRVVGAAA